MRTVSVPVPVLKFRSPPDRPLLEPPISIVLALIVLAVLPSRLVSTGPLSGESVVTVVAKMVLVAANVRVEPSVAVPPELVGSPTRNVPVPRLAKKVLSPLISKMPALLRFVVTLLPSWKFAFVGVTAVPIE